MPALKLAHLSASGILLTHFLPGRLTLTADQRARLVAVFRQRGFFVLDEEVSVSAAKPNFNQLYFLHVLEEQRRTGQPYTTVGEDVPPHVRQFCLKQGWVEGRGRTAARQYRLTMAGARVLFAHHPDYQSDALPTIADEPSASPRQDAAAEAPGARAAIRPYTNGHAPATSLHNAEVSSLIASPPAAPDEQPAWDYHNGPQPASVQHLIAALNDAETTSDSPLRVRGGDGGGVSDELARVTRERDAYYTLLVQMNNLAAQLFLLLLSAKLPDAAPLVDTFNRISQQTDAVGVE